MLTCCIKDSLVLTSFKIAIPSRNMPLITENAYCRWIKNSTIINITDQGASKMAFKEGHVRKFLILERSFKCWLPVNGVRLCEEDATECAKSSGASFLSSQFPNLDNKEDLTACIKVRQISAKTTTIVSISNVSRLPLDITLSSTCKEYMGITSSIKLLIRLKSSA